MVVKLFKQKSKKIKRWFYLKFYKLKMGGFLPQTGKGEFVSVYSKGKIIQIKNEKGHEHLEYDEIRIIPHKDNHGVMVERFKDGVMYDRNLLDIDQFNRDKIFASNIERI